MRDARVRPADPDQRSLRRAAPESPVPTSSAEGAELSESGSGAGEIRVLVIDDDREVRAYARKCIETLHGDVVEVFEAASVVAGIDRMRRTPMNVVVCELHMPTAGAEELIADLRKDPVLRDVPVLIVTGDLRGRRSRARLESLAGVGVLLKPFNARALCGAVEGLVRAQRPSATDADVPSEETHPTQE